MSGPFLSGFLRDYDLPGYDPERGQQEVRLRMQALAEHHRQLARAHSAGERRALDVRYHDLMVRTHAHFDPPVVPGDRWAISDSLRKKMGWPSLDEALKKASPPAPVVEDDSAPPDYDAPPPEAYDDVDPVAP